MSTMTALSKAEFTLLGRNRVLLFNAIVVPLIFLVVGSRNGGLKDAGVSIALESFALFLLVFLVYYNLLSVYATRRDELILKRLRTGESTGLHLGVIRFFETLRFGLLRARGDVPQLYS